MYFEYQTNQLIEKGIHPDKPKSEIEPQTLGCIMYGYLDHMQVTESHRIVIRNIKLKENPLGGLMDSALGQRMRPKDN